MARVLFLPLALLVCAGAAFGNASEVTEFADPCQTHTCPKGKACMKIVSEKLVPFPVATCVKNASSTEGSCRQFAVASNPLNCRTKDEWERAAIIQCSVREEGMVLHEAKVQHVCYSSTGSTPYLRVEITCCPVAMPTSASDSLKPATEKAPSENIDAQNDLFKDEQEPTMDPPLGAMDPLTDTLDNPESSPPNSPSMEPMAYFIPLALGLLVLLVMVLLICFLVWRRLALERRLKKKVQTPRTVYINPDFEDYQVMFYSNKRKP